MDYLVTFENKGPQFLEIGLKMSAINRYIIWDRFVF